MNFTVYLTVKLHRSFNCNFTSIYNSVVEMVVLRTVGWDIRGGAPIFKAEVSPVFPVVSVTQRAWQIRIARGQYAF